jgi:glycolate oxidase FAD binding subunit
MNTVLTPHSEAELSSLIIDAHTKHTPLVIQGGGTREPLGRLSQATTTLSTKGLSGITLYEPSEMIIGAKAGTPLSVVEAALNEKGQMLAFEPIDHRKLFGTKGEPSIGAIAAINASGSRRVIAGAARDSLVGVRFVNGKGEIIKNGGRVMKNVTGLDLVKLQAGAFGTLGVLSEVIFKVLPKQETIASLSFKNLNDSQAIQMMAKAQGSPYEVTAAAYLSDDSGKQAVIRIEGFTDSVYYRLGELRLLLVEFGAPDELRGDENAKLWHDIRDVAFLSEPQNNAVWRICVKPTDAPLLIADLKKKFSFKHFYDWGGGLIWLSCQFDGAAKLIREAVAHYQGHARLERGTLELRNSIEVFQPLPAPLMQVTSGIKKSFDPASILNFGRMYAGI